MITSTCILQDPIDALPCNDEWGVEACRLLLERARELGCSDLHLLSFRWGILARGRKDGGLVDLAMIASERRQMLVARLKILARLLLRREGTILLTGPSGSGKTTTLYAMMQHLFEHDGDRLNFLTIEDPVECDLGFAGQVQVNEAQGLSFERALRAAVRQDPNVLLIGEIRDPQTARIAVQAGMTGHLVLSTIHAGRVARVFSRLLSIGVEPYLLASALTGALAQRLVRVLCPSCRIRDAQADAWTAPGCDQCGGTGNKGRRGVFELALVDEPLRELMLSRPAPEALVAKVSESQTGNLVREGRRLLREGHISRAEFEFTFTGEED